MWDKSPTCNIESIKVQKYVYLILDILKMSISNYEELLNSKNMQFLSCEHNAVKPVFVCFYLFAYFFNTCIQQVRELLIYVYIKARMLHEQPPKNANKYRCDGCDFKCSKLSEYNRHLLTRKHQNATNATQKATQKEPP